MLSDFGIARALGETTRLTSPHGTIGTPAYMAPEQWLGGDVDGRADLYSLGIVLYELLAGSPPFTATTSQGLMRQHLETPVPPLASRRPDLPPGLDQVVQTALAKDPDQRYRHAGELKAALEAAARQPQAPDHSSRTDLVSSGPIMATSPHLGQTMRVADQLRTPDVDPPRHKSGGRSPTLLLIVLAFVVLLAGAVGYFVAGSRFGAAGGPLPTPTTDAAAGASISTAAPPVASHLYATASPDGNAADRGRNRDAPATNADFATASDRTAGGRARGTDRSTPDRDGDGRSARDAYGTGEAIRRPADRACQDSADCTTHRARREAGARPSDKPNPVPRERVDGACPVPGSRRTTAPLAVRRPPLALHQG